MIQGCSTIHFDEVSKKRIYASIDSAKTNDMKLLKESYQNLKYKLGHIPSIKDFGQYGEIDITKIFEKLGSYYSFLVKYEDEYTIRLSSEEEEIIEYLSRKIAKGKRIHELEMLQDLRLARRILYIICNILSVFPVIRKKLRLMRVHWCFSGSVFQRKY